MTLFRLEHAVVMDTDHIPGRGGYGVVGISPGVTQAERAFVAQNFGISDFLHDPQSARRIFYSSFRVPGGRHAFVRRFARGLRRNETQNRMHIHTIFLDDAVFERLHGLPWLLFNASVRLEGTSAWERLSDDVPWVQDGDTLAPLEWDSDDGVVEGVAGRLSSRLALMWKQFAQPPAGSESPEDLVARTIAALSSGTRVTLPQGTGWELLTMMAASMLPWRDREELAWTQHDSLNISGLAFGLANVAAGETTSLTPAAPKFARELVALNTAGESSWWEFLRFTRKLGLTLRRTDDIAAWLDWRRALLAVGEHLREPDAAVIERMSALAATARNRESSSWVDGAEVLQLIWNNVPEAIARGEEPELVVRTWGGRLVRSGLDGVIFREPPDPAWLDMAARDVGADVLVRFFVFGTEGAAAAAATRIAVARWMLDTAPGSIASETMARLAERLAQDRAAALAPLLERLLASDEGLAALTRTMAARSAGELIFAAAPIALRHGHAHTIDFLRDGLLVHLEAAPASRSRVTRELARDVAAVLRDEPETFLTFANQLPAEVRADLVELVTQWLFAEPARTSTLARGLILSVAGEAASARAAVSLAIALANAGEPATGWLRVLLQAASSIDAQSDAKGARLFLDAVSRLGQRPLKLDGAMDPLLRMAGAESPLRPGECVRALVLLLRPVWNVRGKDWIDALTTAVSKTHFAAAWSPIVGAVAEDFGDGPLRAGVSSLVSTLWERIEISDVARVDRSVTEALATLSPAARKRVTSLWSGRVQSLPPGPSSELFLQHLFGETEKTTAEHRITLELRDIRQGVADEATLNRLDSYYARRGSRAKTEMLAALEDYAGEGSRAVRLERLIHLMASKKVKQTVKLLIEQRLLARAVSDMRSADWEALLAKLSDEELLARGNVVLQLGRGVTNSASRGARRDFQERLARSAER